MNYTSLQWLKISKQLAKYTVLMAIYKTVWPLCINPLTRISQFLVLRFVHPNRKSRKTGSITHALIKPSLAQETLVL